MFPDKWLRAKRKMFLECGFFVFSSLTGAEGLWTKTLEKLENCRQDFLFFKWMISLVDDWMSLQTHTCIAELLDIFESVVSVTMKTSSSALTLNWTYENEGTNERSATGHWKCLDEETFIVFTQGGQIKSKVSVCGTFVREQVDYKNRWYASDCYQFKSDLDKLHFCIFYWTIKLIKGHARAFCSPTLV